MKKKAEKGSKTLSYFVRLKTLADFARNASTFGEGVRSVFALKEKDKYRLFAPSIKLGDTRLLFYFETKNNGICIRYLPATATEKEAADVRDSMVQQITGRNVQNIPIIELVKNPFGTKEGKFKASNVEVKDYVSLVKWIISRSIEDGGITKVLAFTYKSKRYIGSFGLMDDEDTKIFFYAKAELAKDYSFFRYNYTSDNVDATDTFGEHSFLYVRIINLAEPFSFFKPE